MKRPVGLEAIILYKLIKAAGELLLCLFAVYLLVRGAEAGAATLAESLLEHFAGAWALSAATLVVMIGTSGHVKFIAVASLGDAILSALEGLALQAGRWWAPWLVVIATASLLPWEVVEIFVHPRWGRFVILGINLTVVAYLLWEVWRGRTVRMPTTASVDRSAPGP